LNKYFDREALYSQFNIQPDALRFELESNRLPVSFLVKNIQILIGVWLVQKKQFMAMGVGNYSGVITIKTHDTKTLALKKRVDASLFYLRDSIEPSCFDSDYPFDLAVPNNYIAQWKPEYLKEFISKPLVVRPMAHSLDSPVNSIAKIVSAFADSGVKENGIHEKFDDVLSKVPEKLLYPKTICFRYENLLIAEGDLEKANVLPSKENAKPDESNRMIQLLKNLVARYPNYTATELWRLLEREYEDNQTLDPYEILIEVTTNHIEWIDHTHKPRKWQKKTFINRYRDIKKKK